MGRSGEKDLEEMRRLGREIEEHHKKAQANCSHPRWTETWMGNGWVERWCDHCNKFLGERKM